MKLKESVSAYKLNNEIYIRSKEEVFQLEEINDKKRIIEFIKQLEKEISSDDVDKMISESEDIKDLVEYLKLNDLLENSSLEKENKGIRSNQILIDRQTLEKNKSKIENFKIGISGNEDSVFSQKLKKEITKQSIKARIVEEEDKFDLKIVIKENSKDEEFLQKVNINNINKNQSCLYIDISVDGFAIFGPLVIPGETACLNCFALRRIINDDTNTKHSFAKKEKIINSKNGILKHQENIVISLVVDEILNYILEINPKTIENILYFDLGTLESWKEALLQYPKCKICCK